MIFKYNEIMIRLLRVLILSLSRGFYVKSLFETQGHLQVFMDYLWNIQHPINIVFFINERIKWIE